MFGFWFVLIDLVAGHGSNSHHHFFNTSLSEIKLKESEGQYHMILNYYHWASNDCEIYRDMPITNDINTTHFIKNAVGPFEVYVSIEGLGLYAHMFKYVGCNEYEVKFYVHQTGAYHVKVIHLRGNFTAIEEFTLKQPPINYQTLMSEWIELHAPPLNKIKCGHAAGAWMLNHQENTTKIRETFLNIELAKQTVPFKGDYSPYERNIPFDIHVMLGHNHHEKGCAKDIDYYSWQPVEECKSIPFYNQTQAGQILRGKNIIVLGDSHAREMVINMVNWACRHGTGCEGSFISGVLLAGCACVFFVTLTVILSNCSHRRNEFA